MNVHRRLELAQRRLVIIHAAIAAVPNTAENYGLGDALRHEVEGALEQLYWVLKLPRSTFTMDAPTYDELNPIPRRPQ